MEAQGALYRVHCYLDGAIVLLEETHNVLVLHGMARLAVDLQDVVARA